MTAPRKRTRLEEPEWSVEQAEDCADDFLVVPLDKDKYVTVRIEPYNPMHPVEAATRGYAEVICGLLNSGVNDANWGPPIEHTKKAKKKGKKKRG